jgi:hypothetical protein
MRRFLERFADHRVDERFARLEMPGRLVQPQALGRVLLHEEKTPAALDDGRHRNVRGPDFRFHGPTFYRLAERLASDRFQARARPESSPSQARIMRERGQHQPGSGAHGRDCADYGSPPTFG